MYKEIITENGEVVDLENKINNNTYKKVKKIFGITFFTHEYTLRWKMSEEKEDTPIGFTTKEKR